MITNCDLKFPYFYPLDISQTPFNPSSILGLMSYANVDSFSGNLHKPIE